MWRVEAVQQAILLGVGMMLGALATLAAQRMRDDKSREVAVEEDVPEWLKSAEEDLRVSSSPHGKKPRGSTAAIEAASTACGACGSMPYLDASMNELRCPECECAGAR